ncbi:RHS repeat-associated core domain-containing protein [Salinibius halmophilus]|uniref:RHS repeat-associated core domain-containing protein n=1 Tax=Salinibius halmophilus TaxID=1853216 RepID=UPI000E669242|nr:RHS repeat-associated core domain-containing protein [Salinibius halmophilus]
MASWQKELTADMDESGRLNDGLAVDESAAADQSVELKLPNAQALRALPHELKTKLFPAPENWGTVDPSDAIHLVRSDSTRFFEYQRGHWVEIPSPRSLIHKNWVCVQRLNKPISNHIGQANSRSAISDGEQNQQVTVSSPSSQELTQDVVLYDVPNTYSLNLKLLSPSGKPAHYATFQVDLDTGDRRTGPLDENGEAYLSGLPECQATIRYLPNRSLIARYQQQLRTQLNVILMDARAKQADNQAKLADLAWADKTHVISQAFINSFWNNFEDLKGNTQSAAAFLLDIPSNVQRLQGEFIEALRAGTIPDELEEAFAKICQKAGVASELAARAWHVFRILAQHRSTLDILLEFAWDYASCLHVLDLAEFGGWIVFEAVFAIIAAAVVKGTKGLGSLLVLPASTERYKNVMIKIGEVIAPLWRILDERAYDNVGGTKALKGNREHQVTHQQQEDVRPLVKVDPEPEQSSQSLNKQDDDSTNQGDEDENKGDCPGGATDNAECAGEPINMATGEELYKTIDFKVPGVVPINFVRQYRTTLCGKRSSLGFGWSHSFSEYFVAQGEGLEFVDQEFLSTSFASIRPGKTVRNQLGMTLDWTADELTLTHKGVVKRFRQLDPASQRYALTHIETLDRSQSWRLIYQTVNGVLQPTQVVASWGDTLSLNYGRYGLASIDWQAASGHKKRLARYIVNNQGDLIAARNQGGRLEQYRFEQHTITLRKLATGAIYDFQWTELGPNARATSQKERGGSYHYQFEWQLEDRISRSIDSNGVVIEYEFDDRAHLIRKTMPDGSEERWFYNSLDDLVWYQNGNGERTEYAYDDQQRLTKQINALGQQTRISYLGDTFLPTRIINAAGHTTRYQYNSLEQLTAIHHPDGREARWQYQGGQLVKQVDANGQIHHYQWHPQWGAIARYLQTTSKGEVLSELAFAYDEQGRLVSQTVVGKNGTEDKTSHFVYDEQGQLTSQIDPFGKSQKLNYDSFGRVVAHIDAAGRTTQFEYGKFAQVERLIQPDGNQVRYEYDKERNLTALINQNGQAHKFEYDVHERISREITVDGRTTDYQYDGAGRITKLTERGLNEGELTATFERNALGMLIREQHEAAGKQSVTIDYQYDELNRLVLADNGHAQTELAYDLAGRLTEELNRQSFNPFGHRVQPHQHKIGIHYRDDGLVSHLHHESFKPKPHGLKYSFMHSDGRKDEWYQEYHWNSQQQLVGMLLNDEQLFSQQFNSAGQLTKRQQGAHQLEFSYDPEMRLAQTKRLGSAHELIKQRDYDYDEFGRLTQISEQGSTSAKPFVKQYQYDAVDRLTSVVRGESGDLVQQQINQDKAGNLLPQGLTELSNNQLPFWGDRHFEYDSHGNLKTETSGANGCKKKQFFYNAKHQLVSLIQSVDRTATLYSEYLYDSLGRRIEKIVWQLDAALTGVETELELANLAREQGEVVNHERFAWQGSTLVHVRKLTNGGNQQLTAERYIYEPGTHVPLAMHDTELGTLHFDVDHLGTPKGLFDSAGEKLWQAEHSVYGQIESERSFKLHPITGEQVAPKIRFQGQYEDAESGLFYNLNRYYDAEVGRYTTQDPIGLLGGLNAYQYCPNPVEWVDPLGTIAEKEASTRSTEAVASTQPGTSIAVYDKEFAAQQMKGYGISIYNEDIYNFLNGLDELTLGPPGGEAWLSPAEHAFRATSKSQLALESGLAGSIVDAANNGGDLYATVVPLKGLKTNIPKATDGGVNPHFLEGAGHTAVRGDNFWILNRDITEVTVPGGGAMPSGSMIVKFIPGSGWVPVRSF